MNVGRVVIVGHYKKSAAGRLPLSAYTIICTVKTLVSSCQQAAILVLIPHTALNYELKGNYIN